MNAAAATGHYLLPKFLKISESRVRCLWLEQYRVLRDRSYGNCWNLQENNGDKMTAHFQVMDTKVTDKLHRPTGQKITHAYCLAGSKLGRNESPTRGETFELKPDCVLMVMGTIPEVHHFFSVPSTIKWGTAAAGHDVGEGLIVSVECTAHPFNAVKQVRHLRKINRGKPEAYHISKKQISHSASVLRKRMLVVQIGSANSPLKHKLTTGSSRITNENARDMIRSVLRGIDAMAWCKASRSQAMV